MNFLTNVWNICPSKLYKEICKNASLGPKNQKNINNSGKKHVWILVYPSRKLNTLKKSRYLLLLKKNHFFFLCRFINEVIIFSKVFVIQGSYYILSQQKKYYKNDYKGTFSFLWLKISKWLPGFWTGYL